MNINTTDIQLNCKANIRKIRESYGYSQSKFAKLFNITTEAYRRIEVGPVNVPIEMLYIIKEKFGVSIDYLVASDDSAYDDTWIDVQEYLKSQIKEMQKRMRKYCDLMEERNPNDTDCGEKIE